MKFIIYTIIIFFSVIGMHAVLNLNEDLQPQFITVDYFAYAEDKVHSKNYLDSSNEIPEWFKTNAGWWTEGKISDDDFTKGIGNLIKYRIFEIPPTERNGNTCPGEIPSWTKKNAGWWANDQIGDASFVEGIQFMMQEGMIRIPNGFETEVTEVKDGMCDALKKIKSNHVTDSLVKSLLPEIPVVGSLLSDMYENSHPEDKIGNIEKLLENYISMSDENLKQQIAKLEENKDEILDNRNYLKQLVSDTSRILKATDDLKDGQDDIKDKIDGLKDDLDLNPPVATFSIPSSVTRDQMILFNANGSYDSDGKIVSYEWDFGDGSVSSSNKNSVAYKYNVDGNYRVHLTVTGDDGLKDTSVKTIVVDGNLPTVSKESPKTDKKRYDVSNGSKTLVHITGEIVNSRSQFTLEIKNPNNEIILETALTAQSSGRYEYTYFLPGDTLNGQYMIQVYDDKRIIGFSTFYVTEISSRLVIIPEGTSSPGCREINDGCYLPDRVSIREGDKITWQNNDSTGHTVTSGNQKSGSDGLFDSSLISSDRKFTYLFDDFEPGKYSYYCEIHPWQTGVIMVQKGYGQ